MRFLMPLNLSLATHYNKLRQSTNISKRLACLENHQDVERLTAGNTGVKKKKEQVQREERLRTVGGRHGTIPVDEYLPGIAHNMRLSECQRIAEETNSE